MLIFSLEVVMVITPLCSATENGVFTAHGLFTTNDFFAGKAFKIVYLTSIISALHIFISSSPLASLKLTPSVFFVNEITVALADFKQIIPSIKRAVYFNQSVLFFCPCIILLFVFII